MTLRPDRSQEENIALVDTLSSRSQPENQPVIPASRCQVVARLFFLPLLTLCSQLFLHGGLFRGVAGLKRAGNETALVLTREAKRYEHSFSDNGSMYERCRDFLDT